MNMYESEPTTQLPLTTSVSADDVFAIVNVNDRTESPSGTTKKVTVATVANFVINNIPWTTVTSGPITLSPNHGYIIDSATLVLASLPATASVGEQFLIEGKGVGLFHVTQNAGQSIVCGAATTTVGTGGYIASRLPGDSLWIMCTVANTQFKVRNAFGNLDAI